MIGHLSGFPDISGILARKEMGRKERAALSFVEKLAILDAMRERVRPIVEARAARNERSHVTAPDSAPGTSSG